MESFLLNIVGNIVGFMPCGFFLPVISRRSRRWFNTVLLSFLFSLCIETIQLIFKVGSFDVDDMILNTLGGILGYILYKIVQHIRVGAFSPWDLQLGHWPLESLESSVP